MPGRNNPELSYFMMFKVYMGKRETLGAKGELTAPCSSTAIFLSSARFILINPEMQSAMKMSFSKGEEIKGKTKHRGKLELEQVPRADTLLHV